MDKTVFGSIHANQVYGKYNLDSEIRLAKESLTYFCNDLDIASMSFLDAGCAGGLYSLAALKLGFRNVASFEYDSDLYAIATNLKKQYSLADWSIYQGSILDLQFLSTLGEYDFIYCWGVVHHTGDMLNAVRNISNLVSTNGYIFFGIYNDHKSMGFTDDMRFGSSSFWKKVKSFLFHSPKILQYLTVKSSLLFYHLVCLFKRDFKFADFNERGMNAKLAIEDWLLGHPYEYATKEEVVAIMKELGFKLVKVVDNSGLRTNNYLFKKMKPD